jgi:4-diphosphocytidyl-2-C-methyl-D-erythritol kinase
LEKAETGEGIVFRCDDSSIPQGAENLVVRAARAFFDKTEIAPKIQIDLQKKIPHGAGLGGGSSDAASVLIALNEIFQTKLSRETLAEVGATLGSDIPFFVFDSAALCRGRGEIVSPRALESALPLLLLKPEFGVATGSAYARWQDSREIPGISYAPQEFHGHRFFNDLERAVFEKFVFLAEMKMWLLRQPEVGAALMSGSGSTMFAVLRDDADSSALSERARRELDPKLWCFACETGRHLLR